MSNIIDAVLRFKDEFTDRFSGAISNMAANSKKIESVGKNISKVGDNIAQKGVAMAKATTIPIATAGVACVKLASDASETASKIEVVFGKNAKAMNKWAKNTIDTCGMASSTALDMASVFGDMADGMGVSGKKSIEMSQNLTQLAGDLASFKNISNDQAFTALKGVFTGEGESLKSLGIIMNDTSLQAYALEKGLLKSTVSKEKMAEMSTKVSLAEEKLAEKIKKYGANSSEAKTAQLSLNKAMENQAKCAQGSYKNLSESEKTMLRYKYIMDKTKNAQGDFARTSDGVANSTRTIGERVKDVSTKIGTALLPIAQKALSIANNMAKKLQGLNKEQIDTIVKVAGIVAVVAPAIVVIGKLTSGVGKAITTFSRINKVLKTGGTLFKALGAGGVAGLVVVGIMAIVAAGVLLYKNWDKVCAWANKMKKRISNMLKKIGIDTKGLGNAFKKLKASTTTAVKAVIKVVKKIATALKPVLNFVKKVFVQGFKVAFSGLKGYVTNAIKGISEVIKSIMKVFTGIMDFITGVFTGNWKKAWEGVKQIFGGVFSSLTGLVKTPFNAIIGLVNGVIGALNKISVKVPKWVPKYGGKKFGFDLAKIPYLAKGTDNWKGGLAVTQDRGGELMDLPRGTRVYPHDESIRKAYKDGAKSSTGKGNIVIKKLADQIVVRKDADIDNFVNELADRFIDIISNGGGEAPA